MVSDPHIPSVHPRVIDLALFQGTSGLLFQIIPTSYQLLVHTDVLGVSGDVVGVGDVIIRCRDVSTNLLKPSRALMGMCCRRCFLDRICLRAPKACSMKITITGLVLLGLLKKTEIKLGLIIVNCSLWLDSVITY